MSYETGTSTGPDDLLDKLRAFLVADGWSVNKWEVDNFTYHAEYPEIVGTGKRLHVQKAVEASGDATVMYFNFHSAVRSILFSNHYSTTAQKGGKYYAEVTGLAMYGSTGYDGGEDWDNQPGHPVANTSECWGVAMTELSTTSIPGYYFFSSGDTVTVCVEYESGKFLWFCFGCLDKEGVYDGGQFFFSSLNGYAPSLQLLHDTATDTETTFFVNVNNYYGCGAVYMDIDSTEGPGWRAQGYQGNDGADFAEHIIVPGWLSNDASPSYSTHNTFLTFVYYRSPNFYNSLAPMFPVYLFVERENGNYSLPGVPHDIRIINCQYYDPADEIALGSDVWMVFPAHAKDDLCPRSCGFAVKKVT
jgi:hypothetical protein